MIGKDFATKQIARLGGLDYFPKGEKEPLNELVLALQCAETEKQARQVIDVWMEPPPRKCPTPAEIRQAIYGTKEEKMKTYVVQPTVCEKCGDSGFRQVVRDGYEFAARCDHKVPA